MRDHAENPFSESNLKKDLFHVPMKGKFILMLLLFQYCWHFHFWSALEIGLSYSSLPLKNLLSFWSS